MGDAEAAHDLGRRNHADKMIQLARVISGGQTGADQGSLAAAKQLGIPTGGWMPRGFLTETGQRPDFAALYGMREHPEPEYGPRNEANVYDADGTLIFGDVTSGGSRNTKEFCAKYQKPCYVLSWRSGQAVPVESISDFHHWLSEHRIRILNVAGNRESGQSGIHKAVLEFLVAALADR